ncbi:MAG: TrbC/VirB2 family protein [Candidatus Altiarchaeota archaeon]|nr:TrbC/VirB2 family protein [Candidatus Altiarchaeota archaeon]
MDSSQRIISALIFCIISLCTFSSALSEAEEISYSINCIFCRIATLAFMLTASLAALVIILAGLKWLVSGEDPAARSAAKSTIVNVFVGIIIIFTAVYLVSYVTKDLLPGADPTLWMDSSGGTCDLVCDPLKDIGSEAEDKVPGVPEEGDTPSYEQVFPEDVEHGEKIIEAPPE